jgi:hypothetical protein
MQQGKVGVRHVYSSSPTQKTSAIRRLQGGWTVRPREFGSDGERPGLYRQSHSDDSFSEIVQIQIQLARSSHRCTPRWEWREMIDRYAHLLLAESIDLTDLIQSQKK